MDATSICVIRVCPSCLLPIQETLKDQLVGLTPDPSNYCFLNVGGYEVLRILLQSLFPTARPLSRMQVPLALKLDFPGISFRTHRLGSPSTMCYVTGIPVWKMRSVEDLSDQTLQPHAVGGENSPRLHANGWTLLKAGVLTASAYLCLILQPPESLEITSKI